MRKAIIGGIILAATVASTSAMASGSGSGGGGGFGSGGFNNAPRISPEERLERRGKSQVRKRITCKKCEYRGRLNHQTAAEIAQAVREGNFKLKPRDREAVLFFLRRRYGV